MRLRKCKANHNAENSAEDYMHHALSLAKRGEFTAHPNPRVGCVLVKSDQIVGEGNHWQAGMPHAEVQALMEARENARGSTCYVTLEPCVHQGLTGPCVLPLIDAGIEWMVIATSDPDPRVAGKGIQALRLAGILVEEGMLAPKAKALNKGFFSRLLRKKPYVRAKMATSLDGRIAMKNGESQWITSEAARQDVHAERAKCGAILTTFKTVQQDDCRLTVRHLTAQWPSEIHFRQPLRVIIDTQLQLLAQAAILALVGQVVVITSEKVEAKHKIWLASFPSAHVRCIAFPEKDGHIDMEKVLLWLAEQGINDMWVEAGGEFMGALLEGKWIDELIIYMAPKLLGTHTLPMACLPKCIKLADLIAGHFAQVKMIGTDLQIIVTLSDFAREYHENTSY